MRGAALIIGSLLWDPNEVREEWRQARLDLPRLETVTAPIRYARRSTSRGNTFTMTFAPMGIQGRAVAVPYRQETSAIDGLIEEARVLWHAEQPSRAAGPIGADWGCVAAAFRSSDDPLRSSWAEFFCEMTKPIWPARKDGVLDIPWPTRVSNGNPYEADYLLATATLAAAQAPSSEQVADAWVNQNDGFEAYFFENVKHGIRTTDDVRIWERIKQRTPSWLRGESYTEAVAILEIDLTNARQ